MSAHLFVAAVYDTFMVPADSLGFSKVRQMIAEKATGKVLEIGTGTGLNFKYFSRAESVIAIEPDKYMIRRAMKRTTQSTQLVRAVAEQLPFTDSSFDTVVSTLTFCTIGDPVAAAREISRVLKSGGSFYFAEHPVSEKPALAKFEKFVTPLWKFAAGGCHLDRDIISQFKYGGLKVAEVIRLDSFFVAGRAERI
ncbi:MAG: class I SAM-dependent methyltransferase [Candidatus Kryptoniota bacterium]